MNKQSISRVFVAASIISAMFTLLFMSVLHPIESSAASADYPVVLLRISTYDNNRHLNISGYDDKVSVVASELKNTQNENWRFDYVGTDSKGSFYKITNMGTGRLLTPMGYSVNEGTQCVIFGSESAVTQHWYVVPVEKDCYGTDLYYKIVNYQNTDMALTNSGNKLVLSSFSGKNEQKWLLNTAGLQGFAGYSKDMTGRIKACDIGGTLGKTIEVQSFDQLKAACTSSEPCTIVITKNISKTGQYEKDSNGRYRFKDAIIYMQPNKTVIGSYGANSLHNVYFQTHSTNYGPGHDIILRNIRISHDKELNNDNIWEFAYGTNFWIDHCEFVGHDKVNGASTKLDDWDKFLNFKGTTDFITISDNKFGLHEYGVLLGYPADDADTYKTYNDHPLVTLADNYYQNTLTRAPALMRYGYFHSFNNYVDTFSMAYTVHTASKIYAENCYYSNGGNVICDWNEVTYPGSYAESGSKFVNCKRTKIEGYAKNCSWRPNSNYTYSVKSADDAQNYCTKYSGVQTSPGNYTYAVFTKVGYPSAGYVTKPSVKMDEQPVQTTNSVTTTTTAIPVVTTSADLLNSELIKELKTENGAKWSINQKLNEGDKLFTDRDFTYYSIPELLKNAEAIMTECDGKFVSGDQAVFTAAKNMTVYTAVDTRVEAIPQWLTDWQKTSMQISASNSVVFDVYSRCVRQGEKIVPGTNGQSSYCVNYTIFAAPHLGDVNNDGRFNVADIVAMQKYLLGTGKLDDWQFGDLTGDNRINSFDMILMRRLIVGSEYSEVPSMPEQTTVSTTTSTTTTAEAHSNYEPEGFSFSGNIYLVGDSTVCEYDSNTQQSLDRYGWGMKLGEQFSGVTVTNLALSGRSSRSFLTEQNYQKLKSSVGKGDYLFIQFGHNDEKTDEAQYPGLGTYPGLDWSTLDNTGRDTQGRYSYEYILTAYYINLAKNKGAVPVLVTPVTRRASNGQPNYQQHTPYQEAMISLGKQYNVPVVDMTELTTQLYTNLYNAGGAAETAKMHCYTDNTKTSIDNTHLSNAGASKIAQMIAEQIMKSGLSLR